MKELNFHYTYLQQNSVLTELISVNKNKKEKTQKGNFEWLGVHVVCQGNMLNRLAVSACAVISPPTHLSGN